MEVREKKVKSANSN